MGNVCGGKVDWSVRSDRSAESKIYDAIMYVVLEMLLSACPRSRTTVLLRHESWFKTLVTVHTNIRFLTIAVSNWLVRMLIARVHAQQMALVPGSSSRAAPEKNDRISPVPRSSESTLKMKCHIAAV